MKLTSDQLQTRLNEFRGEDNDHRRRTWWFMLKPSTMLAEPNTWLDWVTHRNDDEHDNGHIHRFLIEDRITGYLDYVRPVSKWTASRDLRVRREEVIGLPRNMHKVFKKAVQHLKPVVSSESHESDELQRLSNVYDCIHQSLEHGDTERFLIGSVMPFIDMCESFSTMPFNG